MSTFDENDSPRAVRFDETRFWVELQDGRVRGTPLSWYPRLLRATPEQRAAYELSPLGLHWDEIDEDISVAGLLAGRRDRTKREQQEAGAAAAAE